MDNKVVDFEISLDGHYANDWSLYAILENEVSGKKKYGRKFLATKRVKIRKGMEYGEALQRQGFYKMLLDMQVDTARALKVASEKDVEINEDLKKTFIAADSIFII